MGKQKVSDSQLAVVLKDNQYKTYYAVAKAVGTGSQTSFIERCHKIEQIYGIPPRISERGGRPKGSTDGIKRQAKPIKRPEPKPVKVEPFVGIAKPEPKPTMPPDEFFNVKLDPVKERPKSVINAGPEQVKSLFFRPNEQVYYEDRLCAVIMATEEKMILRRNADMHHITITAEQYTENPGILRQEHEKPPITTTGEDVTLRKRTVKEIATNTDKMEPVFDLEMDDNTDAVKDFGPLFEETDYIDEEWGVQKQKRKERLKKFIKKVLGR